MAKKQINDIDYARQRLHALYIKRSVNKDESLTPEIERLKLVVDGFYYGVMQDSLTKV